MFDCLVCFLICLYCLTDTAATGIRQGAARGTPITIRTIPAEDAMREGERTPERSIPAELRDTLRRTLIDEIAAARGESTTSDIRRGVQESLRSMGRLLTASAVDSLVAELSDELFGMGPLEVLMRDTGVSEIMVNGHDQVFVERAGLLEPALLAFESDDQVVQLVRRVIGGLNLRLDETSPLVDARLPDGSRLNAIIPPLSLNGPCVTIRRFRDRPFEVDELIALGTMTDEIASFLERSVAMRANMIVSGGTSSGKTTLLNVLSSFIPRNERLVTIEDAAELKIDHPHVISLESRPPNVEGRGEVTVRDLVRNSLRMRPDRIIVGEVRGAEALDMLQAMNTGHPGSLSTAHANSPVDLLSRLETMVLMSDVNLDQSAVRRQAASAIDLVVHMERTPDGHRTLGEVVSVSSGTDGTAVLETLFSNEADRHRRLAPSARDS